MGLKYQFKKLFGICLLIFFGFGHSAFCQNLHPSATLELMNSGWGAAAIGMGGAYTAVAKDLTAIYWNPAGLAQFPGLQVYGDYGISGDSDEDYAAEVLPNRFDSAQRFAVKGNQFDFAGLSYAFQSGTTRIVPAFCWHRTSIVGLERELKETAGVVEFLTPTVFFQSEGIFQQKLKRPGEEYSLGIAASVNNRILIGGSINFPGGDPETRLTGDVHESFVNSSGTIRSDVTLDQTLSENVSGSSFRIGFLALPSGAITLGATMRFPYTRTAELELTRTGTISSAGSTENFEERATAKSEVEIPFEWSLGAAARFRRNFMLSGSVTYAGFEDTQQIISDSSNPSLIPETTFPFPALRADAAPQHSLLQWRGGIEYGTGQPGQSGIVFRSGILLDGQPYGDAEDGKRANFKGYTFGAGYASGGLAIDAAFISEKGDLTFTPGSQGPSHFSIRRFFISLNWSSQ